MFLNEVFIYVLVVATSLVTYFAGRRLFGLEYPALRSAVVEISEYVGACAVFVAINLTLGMVLVFLIRSTLRFLSIYVLTNEMLVVLSAFQGFVFQLWWKKGKGK